MTMPWAVPPALPGYRVLQVIGQGGFGTVYRAQQLAVGREVALKVDQRVLATERDRRRFVREVTAAGQLSGHPNVVAIHDAGVLPDGRPYLVLELCPGGSLGDRLRSSGPLPVAEVREVGVRIGDALAAAHAAGVLHRDVKPLNILINRYGVVALADFGLAAIPRPSGDVSATLESLTPAYASPEAFRLAEPTPAGDVYSLGATLYALLCGRPPRFPADGQPNLAAIVALHAQPIPDLPSIPPELTAVLRRSMAHDPTSRPTAAALRDALAAVPLPGTGPLRLRPLTAPGPVAPLPPAAPVGTGPGTTAPWSGPTTPPDPIRPATPSPTQPATAPWPGPTVPGQQVQAATGLRPQPTAPMVPGDVAAVPSPVEPVGDGTAARSGRAGRARERRRRARRPVVVVAIALVTVVAGTVTVQTIRGHGAPGAAAGGPGRTPAGRTATTAAAVDAFGTATITDHCPAAAVPGARARCTAAAECWSGMVVTVGIVDIKRRACEDPHVWETFAIAPMPADGTTDDQEALAQHPLVRKVCSAEVLLRSRYGRALSLPAARWQVEPLPPGKDAFAQGVRVYRCVGAAVGDEVTGTFFRPLRTG